MLKSLIYASKITLTILCFTSTVNLLAQNKNKEKGEWQAGFFTPYFSNIGGTLGFAFDIKEWEANSEKLYYTYGFQGTAGKNYIVGSLKTPGTDLAKTYANEKTFLIAAAGDIDNDGEPDILTIDQTGKIIIQKDDL